LYKLTLYETPRNFVEYFGEWLFGWEKAEFYLW
jgi:hypothetical protein